MSESIDHPLDAVAIRQTRPVVPGLLATLRADVRANMGRSGLGRGLLGLVYNPGLLCVVLHRFSAWFHGKGPIGKLASIVIWRFNVFATASYIHPNCRIGPGLRLPHPVGVVIGNGVIVGKFTTIYQNVTLGTSHQANFETYPVIDDNVVIYSGAVVVGGIRVGARSIIAANAVAVRDVPNGTTAMGVPARVR